MKERVDKIYRFLGAGYNLFLILTTPVGVLLGFGIAMSAASHLWFLFSFIVLVALIWLAMIVIAGHSYDHLFKNK